MQKEQANELEVLKWLLNLEQGNKNNKKIIRILDKCKLQTDVFSLYLSCCRGELRCKDKSIENEEGILWISAKLWSVLS